jgi:hypothetical protein
MEESILHITFMKNLGMKGSYCGMQKVPIPTDQCFILSRVTMRITLSDELFLTA